MSILKDIPQDVWMVIGGVAIIVLSMSLIVVSTLLKEKEMREFCEEKGFDHMVHNTFEPDYCYRIDASGNIEKFFFDKETYKSLKEK